MPTITKDGLERIKQAGANVHKSLYTDEKAWQAVKPYVPACLRAVMDAAQTNHHEALQALREAILEETDMEPLTDNEVKLLGGGGK